MYTKGFKFFLVLAGFFVISLVSIKSSYAIDFCTDTEQFVSGCGLNGCESDQSCEIIQELGSYKTCIGATWTGSGWARCSFATDCSNSIEVDPVANPVELGTLSECGAPTRMSNLCDPGERCIWQRHIGIQTEGEGVCVKSEDCCRYSGTDSLQSGGSCSNISCCGDFVPPPSSPDTPILECVTLGNAVGCGAKSSYNRGFPEFCNEDYLWVCESADLDCKWVYGSGKTYGGCIPKTRQQCGNGVLKPGEYCVPGVDTCAGSCEPVYPAGTPGGPFPYRCTGYEAGEDCTAANAGSSCVCATAGTECLDPDNNGYECIVPTADCKASGAACTPGDTTPGNYCCDDNGNFECGGTPPTCKFINDLCLGLSDTNCTASGTGGSPCCSGLTCAGSPGICVTSAGTECSGTGCLDCDPGYSCTNGTCTADPVCDLELYQVPYTGKIIDFHELLSTIYKIMYPLMVGLGLAFIIKAGYKIMTSEGDPQKVKEAQEELTAAILGTAFILLSVVILRIIIKELLGVDVTF